MEITKVNVKSGEVIGYITYDEMPIVKQYRKQNKEFTISPTQQKWLDRECSVINTYDFDTCGRAYSNNASDNLQGYYSQYNTYLDQFENC